MLLRTTPPRYRHSLPHSTHTRNRRSTRRCCRRHTRNSKQMRQHSSNSTTPYSSRRRSCKLPSNPRLCHRRLRSGKLAVPLLLHYSTNDADLTVPSSNNPFASNHFIGQPTSSPVPTPQLPQSTSIPSAASTPALVQGRPLSSASISSGASSLPPRTPISARADALSAVLASTGPGGIDTFGNVGSLRYGGSDFGRTAQRTGTRTF